MRPWRLRNATLAAIVGSTLAHGLVAMKLSAIPSGIETREDRPIEASLAPEPMPMPVKIEESVESAENTVEAEEALTSSETSEVEPVETSEAVTAETPSQTAEAAPVETQAETPPQETAQAVPPSEPEAVQMADATQAMELPPEEVPDVKAPDPTPVPAEQIVTTTAEQAKASVAAVTVPPAPEPVEPPPPKIPPKSKPKPKPVAKPRPEPPEPRLAALTPAPAPPSPARNARRAVKVVGGAPSDIGTSADARSSGATRQDYAALVKAEVSRRAQMPNAMRGGRRGTVVVKVLVQVSSSGRASATIIAGSGNPVADRATISAVQSLSLPPPPGGKFSAIVPVRYQLI